MENPDKKIRLDKWLWAARFFKTRALAHQAINGGRVHVNGDHAKPARILSLGNELRIRREDEELVVIVRGLSDRRRSAPEARTLYEETDESLKARESRREAARLLRPEGSPRPVRPGKKDRRLIRKFIRKDE